MDGKKAHGRACYCHNCKRLRCRAQSIGKGFDVAWLRDALEAGELRERLGEHAAAVLTVHQADKPVTCELSPDANIDWVPDPAPVRRPSARVSGATAAVSPTPPLGADVAVANGAAEGEGRGDDAYALAQEAVAAPQEQAAPDDSMPTLMTRRILLEHREFAQLYLQVRDHCLQPGLSAEQVATNEQTAAELEVHMQQLREMISASMSSGQGQ